MRTRLSPLAACSPTTRGWSPRVSAKIGMKCLLGQESGVPYEDTVYDRVGNILLSRIMAAEVRLVDEGFDIGIRRSWEQALGEVKSRPKLVRGPPSKPREPAVN